MELTIKEKEWYDKLRGVGLRDEETNLLARVKCLGDEFEKSSTIPINDFKERFNQDSPFYQFCIESGRLTSDEINYIDLYRSLQSYI